MFPRVVIASRRIHRKAEKQGRKEAEDLGRPNPYEWQLSPFMKCVILLHEILHYLTHRFGGDIMYWTPLDYFIDKTFALVFP